MRDLRKLRLGAAALALLALAGCSSDKKTQPSAPSNSKSAPTGGPRLFTVPADQMSHVQLVTLQTTDMQRVLQLPGTVAYNQFTTTPVISQVSGKVGRIVVVPGQTVKAEEPLLYVSSPDFAQLRSSYIKARDAHELAHKNYVRSQDLYQHHAIAERDVQAAESAEVQAQADLEAAEQSLRIVGANPDSIMRARGAEVAVTAPIAGEVVERLVAPGQLLQGGNTQCFTISNMSNVWVMVNVYQEDLQYVHVGDPAAIRSDAYPNTFHGKISYLGAALDPATRTLQARVVTDNPGEKLKKDMYVTVTVVAGTIRNTLAVPDAAVLRDAENEPFVYVEAAPGQFAQRSVKLGQAYGGKTQVVAGLQAGDKVVGDGSLFLQFQNSLQQ
ncbi:MAG TPA: efflux RND transporter periplasmic adaptor subunit [Terriglobales bacterium]|nr:efflux RND transporter periplasmic adaptor subunit [Terriglobales bacterium]